MSHTTLKLLLCTIFLLIGLPAAAATITSTATGNLSAGGTWVGGVAPNCTNDDIIIAAGHTVTVDTSCTLGPAGTNTTNAIQCGGAASTATSLVVNSPLVVRGRVQIRQNCTLTISTVSSNTGSWTWFPAATRTYHLETVNTNTGTPVLNIAGEAGDLVLVTTNISASTNRGYFNLTATGPPTITWDYVDLRECGGTGDTATTRCLSYTGESTSSISIQHMRMTSNVGKFYFNMLGLNNFTLDWLNNDARFPRNGDLFHIDADTAAVSGTRRINNNTWHDSNAPTDDRAIILQTVGFTVSGNIFSNTGLIFDSFDDSNTITGNAFIRDAADGSDVSTRGDNDTIVEENIFFMCKDNPHYVSIGTSAAAGADPIVRLNIVDGGGSCAVLTDDGDFVLFQADVTAERNLLINKAGTLFTAGQPTGSITAKRNTLYDAGKGATVGETNGTATQVLRFSSNLIVSMPNGILQDAAFVQQTGPMNLDYNGTFNMSTAGNFNIGADNGYLGAETVGTWRSGTYNSTDDYGQHDIYGDPEFVDSSRTMISWYDSIAGSGGSFTNVRAEMLKLNGTAADGTSSSFNSSYGIAAAKTYLRAGFTPQAAIYDGTGDPDDGTTIDVGAIDVVLAGGSAPRMMLLGCCMINWNY